MKHFANDHNLMFSKLKYFFVILISMIFCHSIASASVCQTQLGLCDYYICMEQQYQCGPDGYFLSFAKKYCDKYQSKEHKFSEPGKMFLSSVRTCLQQKLEDRMSQINCAEIEKLAVDTHVECYEENNFCALPLADRQRIERIGWKKALDPDFFKLGWKLLSCQNPNDDNDPEGLWKN